MSAALRLSIAMGLGLCSMSAVAQVTDKTGGRQANTPAANGSELETVTVTARRREESAQDVPISVNVLSEKDLERRDIRTASDLDKNVSGMVICCSRGTVNFTWVRGVPGVVGYFAEVPVTLNGSGLYFDVANVQALKGPQGTLFGLSTNGGAILNEPVRPSADFGGWGALTIGDFNRQTYDAVINVPVSDTLQLRIGGEAHRVDGYVRDNATGNKLGGEEYQIGRVSAVFHPSDSFTNYTVFNYYSNEAHPLGAVNIIPEAFNPNGLAVAIFGPAVQAYMDQQRALGTRNIVGLSVPVETYTKTEQLNLVNITSYELNDATTLRAILGAQQLKSNVVGDTDMSPFPLLETSLPNPRLGANRQYTVEPQVEGSALDKKLTYVVGSFNRWLEPQDNPPPQYQTIFGARSGTRTKNTEQTNSIYAEGTYHLTDAWSATAGYRYSWDQRDSESQNFTAAGDPAGPVRTQEGKWSAPSYRVGVNFQPSAGSLIYLMNSKGYSSGGFNSTNLPVSLQVYGPESLNNFELGLKQDWFFGGAQLRTNFAIYYGLYDDIQVQVVNLTTNPDSGQVQTSLAVQNAAKGTISGAEAEFTFIPVPSLELSGNLSYMDSGFDKYVSADPTDPTGQTILDQSDLPFLFTPRWKYHVGATYHLPINSSLGELSVTAAYSWQDEVANTARPANAHPYVYNPPLDNLDADITWRDLFGKTGLTATFFMTNVTDFERVNGQFTAYDTLGEFGYSRAVPRSWGIRVRYDF